MFPKNKIDNLKLFSYFRKFSDEVFEMTQIGELSISEMHKYRIKKSLNIYNINISDEKAILFQRTYEKFQKQISLSKEIKEILDYCSNHNNIDIGIITNGEIDRQWNKIKTLELSQWITKEMIFISGEIGYSKPNKKIFEFVENKLKLNKDDTYFIGDSNTNDVIGSCNAGWKSIWLNKRKVKEPDKLNNLKKVIYSEKELLRYIKNL